MSTINFDTQPYVFRLEKQRISDIFALTNWCEQIIEKKPYLTYYNETSLWHLSDTFLYWIFIFIKKEHATMFSLTWCNYE